MRSFRFVSVVIVGAFVLAACGGGDNTDAASPPASAAAGSVPGGSIDAAQCAQVVTAMSAAAAAVPAAMSGGAGDLSTSLDQLKAFADAAPEEIRADLMTVYQAYGEFMSAMQDAGYDPTSGQPPGPEVIAAMQQASQKFQDPEFKAASDRVQAWFTSNCGT